MSSALRLPAPPRLREPARLRSTLVWLSAAGFLALIEGTAAYLDPKLGLAVAVVLVGALIVISRPARLVPIAIVTIFVEGLTFNDVAISRVLAPCALLVLMMELLRGAARVRVAAPLLWAAGYVAWAFTSALWTASLAGTQFAIQSLAIALIFMFIFAALLDSERDLRRLLYVLAFVSAVSGLLSVLAFMGSPQEIAGFSLIQSGRGQGLVGDPDFFAAMQLVAVPLVLVLANQTENPAVRIALTGALFATLASVFTSLSRGAFLALLILALLLVWSRPERLFQSRRQKAVALLVACLGMVGFFSRPYAREQVTTRAESIYAPKNRNEASGAGRTNLWKAAEQTATEHPLLGVGAGSFAYISEDLLLRTPGVDPLLLTDRREGDNFVAHNTYLGTAAELGVTGLLLYLGVIVSTGLALRRTAARARAAGRQLVARVAHGLLLGLVAWSFATIFLSGEAARMFWVIVGISLALPKLIPQVQERAGYGNRSKAPMSKPAPPGRRRPPKSLRGE